MAALRDVRRADRRMEIIEAYRAVGLHGIHHALVRLEKVEFVTNATTVAMAVVFATTHAAQATAGAMELTLVYVVVQAAGLTKVVSKASPT
jgi:hypothetical protein